MIKIAIVDDEKIFVSCFQKDLKRLFQQNKVTCIIASFTSGQDFLKNYQETEYDLIFLDIDIPDVSGIQIASDIRNKKLKLNTTLVQVMTILFLNQFTMRLFDLSGKQIF